MTSFSPPVDIAAWLGCLTFCVWLFNGAAKAWFTLRGKPSPEEQAAATNGIASRVATIEHCIGACKHEQDRRLDELEAGQAMLRELITEENGKIYNRVNAAAETCSRISGELTSIKSTLEVLLVRTINGRK